MEEIYDFYYAVTVKTHSQTELKEPRVSKHNDLCLIFIKMTGYQGLDKLKGFSGESSKWVAFLPLFILEGILGVITDRLGGSDGTHWTQN